MIVDDTLTENDFDGCFDGEPIEPTDPLRDLQRGRLRRQRRRALAMALPAAAGVVGFATLMSQQPLIATPVAPPTPITADPTPRTDRTFLMPPDSPQRITYGSTVSAPAPRDATARLSSQRALDLTKTSWRGYEPAIALRFLSSARPDTDIDGVNERPQLYWVVVWEGGVPPLSGPVVIDPTERALRDESQRRWRATAQCRWIVFLDARTGQGHDLTNVHCV